MVNIVDSEPKSGVMTPLEALKKYWGYDSFRPNQQAIIQTVMGGRDCVALLPTGGGEVAYISATCNVVAGHYYCRHTTYRADEGSGGCSPQTIDTGGGHQLVDEL